MSEKNRLKYYQKLSDDKNISNFLVLMNLNVKYLYNPSDSKVQWRNEVSTMDSVVVQRALPKSTKYEQT